VPTVRVAHEELKHRAWPTLRRMLEDMRKAGVPLPTNTETIIRGAKEWLSALNRRSRPAGSKSEKEEGLITSMLNAAIAKQQALPGESSGAPTKHQAGLLDWPVLPSTNEREAYATLFTSPGPRREHMAAAAVLRYSLQMFDASRDLVALVTEQTPEGTRRELRSFGYKVRPVPLIPDTWWGKNYSQCQTTTTKESARSEEFDKVRHWGLGMSKLHLWNMLEYDKVVYFDFDAIITGPVNALFGMLPSVRAVDDPKQVIVVGRKGMSQSGFNAGIIALVPSRKLFLAMVERTQRPPPERRADDFQVGPARCIEQALLNDMIPRSRVRFLEADMLGIPHVRDWQAMGWTRRPYGDGSGWPLQFHWVGCIKPWLVRQTDVGANLTADGTLKKHSKCDGVPYVLWWRWARKAIPPYLRERLALDPAPKSTPTRKKAAVSKRAPARAKAAVSKRAPARAKATASKWKPAAKAEVEVDP
jgi:hypothetical protein